MKAEQKLTASYEWTDEPLETSDIDGLDEAIDRVKETHEREFVRCEDRTVNYDVYWNETTDAVRVAAVVVGCTYEVDESKPSLSDYSE
jgi:hypothetical protein